jgi:hypothetical protein
VYGVSVHDLGMNDVGMHNIGVCGTVLNSIVVTYVDVYGVGVPDIRSRLTTRIFSKVKKFKFACQSTNKKCQFISINYR